MDAARLLAAASAPILAAVPARIPGAVLGIVTASGTRAIAAFGLAQREPHPIHMHPDTLFDLASLTKPLFTTQAILALVAQGCIALDDPLSAAIPDLRQYDLAAPERRLTYRQCLSHQTHLPAVEPLYTYGQDPSTLRAFILQREWRPGPPVYSDINFILLGIALERLSATPLIDHPLPPGITFRPDPTRTAATERCTWRNRILRGEVHDENAAALGGASGHAGLFGTAGAVLDAAAPLLHPLAPPFDAVLTRQSPTRTIGWEAHHPTWPAGPAPSPASIGHTGFTGTGLWIDPPNGVAWTLLTNRVHPSRHVDTGIAALRRDVATQVIAAR